MIASQVIFHNFAHNDIHIRLSETILPHIGYNSRSKANIILLNTVRMLLAMSI